MNHVYVYPRFSNLGAFGFRKGGPGLGNLFFPYARALLFAKERGFTLINPSWATFKLGTFLRGEKEKRMYLQIFKPVGISGIEKTFLLLGHRKITESAAAGKHVPLGSVVLTHGLGNLFKDIAHDREYLADKFWDMLRLEDAARIRALGPLGIGVHVRLGDFPSRHRVPIDWYIRMIEKIRRITGVEVPVVVTSDGTDAELADILRLPRVRRLRLGAVGELFALAQSKVILASDSTFSAWAAFLGHVPILWCKRDASLDGLFADNTINELALADGELSSRAQEYLRRSFPAR
jgi:hypothetical protein